MRYRPFDYDLADYLGEVCDDFLCAEGMLAYLDAREGVESPPAQNHWEDTVIYQWFKECLPASADERFEETAWAYVCQEVVRYNRLEHSELPVYVVWEGCNYGRIESFADACVVADTIAIVQAERIARGDEHVR